MCRQNAAEERGTGPSEEHPAGSSPALPPGLEPLLRLLWEAPGLGGSVPCLGMLFAAGAAPSELGLVLRVPRPPPPLATNAASTRFAWLSLTAPGGSQTGIPPSFTCRRRCLLIRSKRSKPGADPGAEHLCWAPSRGDREGGRMLPRCHGSLCHPPSGAAFCPGFLPDSDYSCDQLVP